MLTFYGVGTIVGGGFYALVGEVAGCAGMHTPIAFLVASTIALFSALSYAELSARYPYSAGESYYVMAAFRQSWLSTTVGWLVIATGVVSAATLANAFAIFLHSLVPLPTTLTIIVLVVSLAALCVWGIGESVLFAAVITVIEVGGLLFVIAVAGDNLSALPNRMGQLLPSLQLADWLGILLGGYLAFYSFVGFEDMVNVAEEVQRPQRNLPLAIMLALGLTSVLYVVVTLVAVTTVSPQDLAATGTPLSLVVGGGRAATALSLIGLLAGINGALVQIVMASRVAYGMGRKGQGPAIFARVNRRTQTPIEATIAAAICVLLIAIVFPLVTLAKITSAVLLTVYALVNLALWTIKRRDQPAPANCPAYPDWVPAVGFSLCTLFVVFQACWTISDWIGTR
jgi:amino acid transporter